MDNPFEKSEHYSEANNDADEPGPMFPLRGRAGNVSEMRITRILCDSNGNHRQKYPKGNDYIGTVGRIIHDANHRDDLTASSVGEFLKLLSQC